MLNSPDPRVRSVSALARWVEHPRPLEVFSGPRSEDSLVFGELLHRLRQRERLSARVAGQRIGVKSSTVAMYERGERVPTLQRAQALLEALQATPTTVEHGTGLRFTVDLRHGVPVIDATREAVVLFEEAAVISAASGDEAARAPAASHAVSVGLADIAAAFFSGMAGRRASRSSPRPLSEKHSHMLGEIMEMLVQDPDQIEHVHDDVSGGRQQQI